MGKSRTHTDINRRSFLGAGAAVGAVGLATPGLKGAKAQVSDRFAGLTPLRPAPEVDETLGSLTPPPLAALVYNKAGFGPRPGDIDAFNALGGNDNQRITAWVDEQLSPTNSDPAVDSRVNPLTGAGEAFDTINKTPLQLWLEHARFDGNDGFNVRRRPVIQMERLLVLRGAYSQWQLREVLADFWFNHFNVLGDDFPSRSMMPHYDREIRADIFGNFGDLLATNTKTASMLFYLDNVANTWPNPNENYAREVLELHTLGAIENYYGAVDPATVPNNSRGQRAGYTEVDVMEFAKALTGWTIDAGDNDDPRTGEFLFLPDRHYDEHAANPIEVMDISIATDGGESDVTDILDYLVGHYGTARFIAWKLCTRLIGDSPPESIVSSTADVFFDNRAASDQLRRVYRHILLSNEFRTTWGNKIKRPLETVIRAMRGADVDLTVQIDDSTSNNLLNRIRDAGQRPFDYEPPTGYPDEKGLWQGTGPLVLSWRAVTWLLQRSEIVNLADQTNAEINDPNNRTPSQIVDTWMFRALGYALAPNVANRMIDFVVDVSGVGATDPLDDASNIDTTDTGHNGRYNRIVRAVVGLVLMSPDAMRR